MSHPVKDPSSKRLSDREPRTLRGGYDAARTTDDNRRHWGAADGLSAKAANNIMVRRLLRTRARYEVANNSYLTGIVETLGNDTIGTGPRLQMLCTDERGESLDELNSFIEERFEEWADEVGLDEKLRLLRESGCVTGESFAVFIGNPMLESPVKLDLELYEGDQFSDPTWQSETSPLWSDGIQYDIYGNPVSYRRLRWHPGDLTWGANPMEFEDLPARFVFHYFKKSRPGQRRGIPEFAAALSNWPELRRYCDAVIAAAETAADHAMTIQSVLPPENDDDDPEPLDDIELKKRRATVLPKGYTMAQTRAEQPTTTYPSFVDKKVAEGSRCVSMPFTIAALDSSNSNLSARYLDAQIYAKTVRIARKKIARLLNRMLDLWLTEAVNIAGFLPAVAALVERFPHKWYWPSIHDHADPDKVASAQSQRLKNGTSSLADECAEDGQDWEEVQQKAARSFGIPLEKYQALVRFAVFGATEAPEAGAPGAGGPGGAAVDPATAPLNGAQITAAIDVLVKLREQILPPEAAQELLAKIGFSPESAATIVSKTPVGLDNGKGDVEFKREVLKLLLAVPQAREATYNATDLLDLITKTGLKPEPGYIPPFASLVAPIGPLTSGSLVLDPAKDTVGADTIDKRPPAGSKPASPPGGGGPADNAGDGQQGEGNDTQAAAEEPDAAERRGVLKRLGAWLGITRD